MTLINTPISINNSLSTFCKEIFDGVPDCAKKTKALSRQILANSSEETASSFRLRRSPSMENIYIERETLGNGAFSEAIKIDRYSLSTNQYSASSVYKSIKPLDPNQDSISRDDQIRSLKREYTLSKKIPLDKQDNLALPFKADYDPKTKKICGLHVKKYGPSLDRINDIEHPLEFFSRQYAHAAKGLENLHSCGYTHRDIHPGNIFSETPDLEAALGDFGCSSNNSKEKLRGQIRLLPPEFKKQGEIIHAPFLPSADIFAFGKSMLETLNTKIHTLYNNQLNIDLKPISSPNTVDENTEKLLAANYDQNLVNAYNDYAMIAINCSLYFALSRPSIQELISNLENLSSNFHTENRAPNQQLEQKIGRLTFTGMIFERAYATSPDINKKYAY